MSIVGNLATSIFATYSFIFLAALFISLPLALRLRVYQPRLIVGPIRLTSDRPAFPLLIAVFMAFCAYLFAASFYLVWKQGGKMSPPGGAPFPTDMVDKAFLYSVPPLMAAIVILGADIMVGGGSLLRQLGIASTYVPRGIAVGVVAALIIVPPTYLVSFLTEQFYRQVQFQHPGEHELLTVLAEAPAHKWAHWVLIAAATLIAPFSEELLFRAHLQTLIARVLVLASIRPKPGRSFGFPITPEALPVDPEFASTPLPPMATVIPEKPTRRPVWQTWLAIFITSILFAAMHERWMWPPIFFLSLGLGYCYERTGNFWTNVVVHSLFNSISTYVFLSSVNP